MNVVKLIALNERIWNEKALEVCKRSIDTVYIKGLSALNKVVRKEVKK